MSPKLWLAPFALTLAMTAPAGAGAGSDYVGGCVLAAVQDPEAPNGTYTGVAFGAVTVFSTDPQDNPVNATLTCSLRLNAVEQVLTTGTATGTVHAPPVPVTVTADEDDTVELCTEVVYVSDATPPAKTCWPVDGAKLVYGPIDALLEVTDPMDLNLCPILASLQSKVPGVVEINSEGDVYLLDEFVWDCPPYTSEPREGRTYVFLLGATTRP